MSANTAASQPAPSAAPVAQPEAQSNQVSPNTEQATSQVDDIEIELDTDLRFKKSELRERIRRQKELEKGSYERFQQAAQIRKQTEALIHEAKTNPAEFLRKTGIDPEEFAKGFIQDRVKYYEMTPEQRELLEAKTQVEKFRREKENLENETKAQKYQQEVIRNQQYFSDQFAQAMEVAGLPRTPQAIKRMAEKTEVYLQNEIPVDFAELAREVKQDYIEEYNSTLTSWDEKELRSVFKNKAADKIRGMFLQDVKTPSPQQKTNTRAPVINRRQYEKKLIGNADLTRLYAQKLGR